MAQKHPFSDLDFPPALAALVEDEIDACRAILAATEAVEAATDPLDMEGIDEAMATRRREFRRLETLEIEAEALRGELFEPPPDLGPRLEVLREFTSLIREADARAREAAQRSLEDLRRRLAAVNHGRQGLRGYRRPADPVPRFTDKHG